MSNESAFNGPGIIGLMLSRPHLAKLYSRITDMLLCGPKSLPREFRERIGQVVSQTNSCAFCEESHCAVAHILSREEGALLDAVPMVKRTALMVLALTVSKDHSATAIARNIEDAKDAGAHPEEIHDTVLIAAWFSFLNRYVNALNPTPHIGFHEYIEPAQLIAECGYEATLDSLLSKSAAPPPGSDPVEQGAPAALPHGRVEIAVGKELFRFESKQHWIDWAQRFYHNAGFRESDVIALDAAGRVCRKGLEFTRAEKEGTFPVVVYALDNAVMLEDE